MPRIISGEYGSRKLETPKGTGTRPTSDRVRESLFSIIQGYLHGARVLDLFAGSGAFGFEALSRGCAHAAFVELGREAFAVLRRNAEMLGCEGRAGFYNCDYKEALSRLAGDVFDIVFIDPPYARLPEILPGMLASLEGVTDADSLVIIEHNYEEIKLPESWELSGTRKYGTVRLSLVKRRGVYA